MKPMRGVWAPAVAVVAAALAAWAWYAAAGAEGGPPKRRPGGRAGAPAAAARGTGAADAAPQTFPPADTLAVRVEFASRVAGGRKEPTEWDGSLTVSGGRVAKIESWSRDPRDVIDGNTWKVTTRRSVPWTGEQRKRGHDAMPLQDAALLITLAETGPDTELSFDTRQGAFKAKLADVLDGRARTHLNGMVSIRPAAVASTILSAPTEDDYPAAAVGPDGSLYVAYVAFRHGKNFRRRGPIESMPETFADLAQPTGGDQPMLMKWDGRQWHGPWEAAPAGGDVFRPAVTVDGDGAVWVAWSAKAGSQWDLFARRRKGDQWAAPVRLTNTAGSDLFATAATDSEGRAWLAWMAFGAGGHADILAARQSGEKFDPPQTVCDRPGNQWQPAIAASGDGQVSVAWDSYENGNYDVFFRTWAGGTWGEIRPVAASLQGEMRPAVVYDRSRRLWVAFEKSPANWGKDTGPTIQEKGVRLQANRTVEVVVWDGSQWKQPAVAASDAFDPPRRGARQADLRRGGVLGQPVIAADVRGRIWLAVRTSREGQRVNIASVWFTHAVSYEGDRWSDEIVCSGTDQTFDCRPALAAMPDGRMALVSAADGRQKTAGQLPAWFVAEIRKKGEVVPVREVATPRWPDPVNSELAMAWIGGGPAAAEPVLANRSEPAAAAGPDEMAKKEAADIAAIRAARTTVGGATLRILRGEFHRHTELSNDGGGDGMLMDMWRYGLDAAGLDWIGNGDHDNGGGREYPWWITQKSTDFFFVPGAFAPVYSYERSVSYPDGHRNVVFAHRGVRTLPRLTGGTGRPMDDKPEDFTRPNSPDTQMLYRYLAEHDGICASHTSGTDMGTDWRDNDPKVEPVVEIFQGCRQNYEMPGAPRANTAENSIGGWRPLGFVSLALKKGYRLGFQSSSDHGSTHISYCNVWAEDITPDAIVRAMKARHVYGATDNIIAEVRCGDRFMGDEFTVRQRPTIAVRLRGTGPFARVHIIKDGAYAHTVEPGAANVEFEWTDMAARAGVGSYYYVRGEQQDGELVWVSPMWITWAP